MKKLTQFNEVPTSATHIGHWDWDLRSNEVYFSPEWKRQLGYENHEIPNRFETWESRLHPDDLQRTIKAVEDYIAGRRADYAVEFRLRHKDGSYRCIYTRAEKQFDDTGKPCRLFGCHVDITKRKQAEGDLRKSEERFRATFEQAAVGIAHVSPEGRFLRVNQKSCDIAGYSREEMLECTFQEITYPDDLKADVAQTNQLLSGEIDTYSMEKRYIRKDGELVWINLTVALVRDEEGQPEWFVAVVKDISERKLAEEKIKESEEKYMTMVEYSNDMIWTLDKKGDFTYFNKKSEEITEYKIKEELNKGFSPIILEEDLEMVYDVFRRTLQGKSLHYEVRIHDASRNKLITLSVSTAPIYNDKEIIGTVSFGRDITTQKQAEKKIRESEEKYRALVDQAQDGITILQDGKIKFVNPYLAKLQGYTVEELLNTSFTEHISPDELPRIKEIYQRRMNNEPVPSVYESVIQTKDGSRKEVEFSAGVTQYNGEPADLVIVRDITERKKAEKELQKYQQRLKALASQLTLAEERERCRVAGDLHDQIGQSLALARIQLATAGKMTADAKLTAVLDDISESLRQSIQETRHLILDLSSPSMNELGLAAALSEWLEEQLQKRYGLKTEFVDECGRVPLSDDVRAILFRSVRELLTNVVKHAHANEVTVSLKCVGACVRIIIQDDGAGFDPAAASEMTDRESGFGLFSIRERMTDLGGSLEIVSEPGKGCKAILTAPLVLE